LDYVSGQDGVRYLTNGQLAQFAHPAEATASAVAATQLGKN